MARKPRSFTTAVTTHAVTRTRQCLLPALLAATAILVGCGSAGDRAAGTGGAIPIAGDSPHATASTGADTAVGGGPVFTPATSLEEFRTRWNDMAERSADSDPFGIFRLEPAAGDDSLRVTWPHEGMILDIAFDPSTRAIRALALGRPPGNQDRQAFVHVMAVLITVSTPGESLDQRVALYERLGDASAAAGGGPFRFSVDDRDLTFTLMSSGYGDMTLTVAPLGFAEPGLAV